MNKVSQTLAKARLSCLDSLLHGPIGSGLYTLIG